MSTIESLIEKWEKEFDFYKEKLDEDKCESLDQLYMSHFETRQIRAFIEDLEILKHDNKHYLIDKEDACSCKRPIAAHPRHLKAGELNKCGGCQNPFRVQFRE